MTPTQTKNRPDLELLEERQLLAASATLDAATGILNIQGTRKADRVEVNSSGDVVTVRLGRRTFSFAASQVTEIVARLGAGNDRFYNNTSIRCSVFGEAGKDTIVGGTDADHMNGGPGGDRLRGGGGDDAIVGGPGRNDRNLMYGEDGIDSFQSSSPRDLIDPGSEGAGALSSGALYILQKVNEARVARGLNPLVINPQLQAAAQGHADNMARLNRYGDTDQNGHYLFGQDFVARAHAAGYTSYSVLGENVAYNYGYSNPAQQLFTQWWNSAGHRENILWGDYTEIGIGVATSAQGRTFGVQMFGHSA